jgi:hypothetical protein
MWCLIKGIRASVSRNGLRKDTDTSARRADLNRYDGCMSWNQLDVAKTTEIM